MTLSLSLFGIPLDEYGPLAQHAERIGLGAVWLDDHLATPTHRRVPYPDTDSGDPGYDASTLIADVSVMTGHLAALTTRLHIG